MYDIDKIMEMLDWNNSSEIQNRGVELAKNVKSINVFLQPLHPGCNKNVWENCAKILASKDDKTLLPYTDQMLEWLQDLNWPGALIILRRLKNFSASDEFVFAVEECVKMAVACDEQIWLDYLSELLDNEPLKAKLPDEILTILKKHYQSGRNY